MCVYVCTCVCVYVRVYVCVCIYKTTVLVNTGVFWPNYEAFRRTTSELKGSLYINNLLIIDLFVSLRA